jgi:hypothetical protein
MIVDIHQENGRIDISYLEKDGSISILSKRIDCWKYKLSPIGAELTWDGQKCEKTESNKLGKHEVRQFLNDLPESEKNLLFQYATPKVWACDIEIDVRGQLHRKLDDITEKADVPVNLITVTNERLDTVVFALEQGDRTAEKTGEIRQKIENRIFEHISDSSTRTKILIEGLGITKDNPPKVKIYWYSSEDKMLRSFFKAQANALHCTIWWNSEGFDNQYLTNRALVLSWEENFTKDRSSSKFRSYNPREVKKQMSKGRSIQKSIITESSPCGKFRSRGAIIPDSMLSMYDKKPIIYTPLHGLNLDYMVIIDKFSRRDSKSLKLDVICQEKIGIGKVSYEGNFESLINGSTEEFIFYGCIDTVALMILHLVERALSQLIISAFDARVPILDGFYVSKCANAVFSDYFYTEKGLISISTFERNDTSEKEEVVKTKNSVTIKEGYHFISNRLQSDGNTIREFRRDVKPLDKKVKRYEGGYVAPNRLKKILFSVFLDAKSLPL